MAQQQPIACTFFGHRDAPECLEPLLYQTLRQFVASGVTMFYVGHQGNFDRMVCRVLRRLKEENPLVQYYVVLAYLDAKPDFLHASAPTLFPEGLETVPRRFAIARRNDWMIKQSQMAICYVKYCVGGAAQFAEKARHKGLRVVNLS